jgi:hypothetical protein
MISIHFILNLVASKLISTLTTIAATMVTTSLVLVGTAQANCYTAAITAPSVTRQTIVVIDKTTLNDPVAVRDFSAHVNQAARLPGRLVILSFAGLTTGQFLAREYDVTLQAPITDDKTKANTPIIPFKQSQACISAAARSHRDAVAQTMIGLLKTHETKSLERSEIELSLKQVLGEFAQAGLHTDLFIYSDGLQHTLGQSFYKANAPRLIDPEKEFKLAQRLNPGANTAAPAQPVQVYWYGLLATDNPKRYADAKTIAALNRFWLMWLSHSGVPQQAIQIGLTLNNPVSKL